MQLASWLVGDQGRTQDQRETDCKDEKGVAFESHSDAFSNAVW